MLKKPNLIDKEIITCLKNTYDLDVATISFLPLGADLNTAVYRVTTTNQTNYFLKLRKGPFCEASVSVPKYLADSGLQQIIPPVSTTLEKLSTNLGSFQLILYPYIDGYNGLEAQLSDDHWVQFGAAIKKLHNTHIPETITKDLPREKFSSKWRETVKAFLCQIQNEVFEEPITVKAAEFLKSKRVEILKMIEHTEELAFTLQAQELPYILCHADIHGWNLLINKENNLYIVDWDTLIVAPKERDLMFIGAGIWNSGRSPIEEESLFYKGYGLTEINNSAICYYRFERIIQDIGEYCEHIFQSENDGNDRMQSLDYLLSSFLSGSTIERAYQSYYAIKKIG